MDQRRAEEKLDSELAILARHVAEVRTRMIHIWKAVSSSARIFHHQDHRKPRALASHLIIFLNGHDQRAAHLLLVTACGMLVHFRSEILDKS